MSVTLLDVAVGRKHILDRPRDVTKEKDEEINGKRAGSQLWLYDFNLFTCSYS